MCGDESQMRELFIIQRFKDSKIQRFKDSKIQSLRYSKIQSLRYSKIQSLRYSKIQDCGFKAPRKDAMARGLFPISNSLLY